MPVNIAINGFGRIGRNVVRALFENNRVEEFNLVAINEIAEPEGIAHLLKYDTTHGRFPFPVELKDNNLYINGKLTHLSHEKSLDKLPWKKHQVDIVFECTGKFSHYSEGEQHLVQGAKKVLFSHPASSDSDVDATIIYGINQHTLTHDRVQQIV